MVTRCLHDRAAQLSVHLAPGSRGAVALTALLRDHRLLQTDIKKVLAYYHSTLGYMFRVVWGVSAGFI